MLVPPHLAKYVRDGSARRVPCQVVEPLAGLHLIAQGIRLALGQVGDKAAQQADDRRLPLVRVERGELPAEPTNRLLIIRRQRVEPPLDLSRRGLLLRCPQMRVGAGEVVEVDAIQRGVVHQLADRFALRRVAEALHQRRGVRGVLADGLLSGAKLPAGRLLVLAQRVRPNPGPRLAVRLRGVLNSK